MPTIATVGVYEFDAASFIRTLDAAAVSQIVDIRQRRGVRGPRYAWANARRLQALLADARIGYEHRPEFAPTTDCVTSNIATTIVRASASGRGSVSRVS